MTHEIATIVDTDSGTSADVLPSFGFNCFRFRPCVAGRMVDALWSPPGFDSGDQRPSRGGIPLLFPYPGRMRGKTLVWDDREYALDGDDGHGNAIHGYVLNRPWQVVEHAGSRIVGRFRASEVDATLRDKWPADFELTITYTVAANRLSATIEVYNPDDRPLPFGFGMHPWFRVPLATEGSADDCLVHVPVTERWRLNGMLPTGEREPALGAYDLKSRMRFADCRVDDCFTGYSTKAPDGDATQVRSTIDDSAARLRLTITFARAFRECVVFTPPHREAICIEPYTSTPNAIELSHRGIDSGLRVLAPGERLALNVAMSVESLVAFDAQ